MPTEVSDSGLVVDSELSRSVGMSSACHLYLARQVEAAKADDRVRGAGDGGPTPVGIDMRLLGEGAPVIDPVPVGIVLSRRLATLMLDERTLHARLLSSPSRSAPSGHPARHLLLSPPSSRRETFSFGF